MSNNNNIVPGFNDEKDDSLKINLEKVILTSNLTIGFQMPKVDESYDTTLPLYLFVNSYFPTLQFKYSLFKPKVIKAL